MCVPVVFWCFVGPAVDHGRRVSGVLVHVFSDQMPEADEELGGLWYSVIRPGCEVEVTHRAGLCCFHLKDEHERTQAQNSC